MSIKERLQLVLKMHNLTPSVFADKIGVQRSNVSHVLSGRNKPGLDFLEKILLHFPRVNAHWLITGVIQDQKELETQKQSDVTDRVDVSVVKELSSIEQKKDISQIVVFYKDKTFSIYSPSEE